MKFNIHFFCLISCLFIAPCIFGQYNWKLCKDKDGIKVYQSVVTNSNFKAVKVECTLQGNYDKLLNILSDVEHHKDWVYNNKTSYVIKTVSPVEFYYYTETSIPWPMSNRDAVVHVKIGKDSLNRFITVNEASEPNYISEKNGIVRIPVSTVSWYVTMPSTDTISILFIVYMEPGGSMPAWVVNMFMDKGPYESFKKLEGILKQ